jgi:hypothetical protein
MDFEEQAWALPLTVTQRASLSLLLTEARKRVDAVSVTDPQLIGSKLVVLLNGARVAIGSRGGYEALDVRSYPAADVKTMAQADLLYARQSARDVGRPAAKGRCRSEGDVSLDVSWRGCAENYLKVTWIPFDRAAVPDFVVGKLTCETLNHLCVEYSVARTIPGNGTGKYRQFLDMLNRHRETVMTRENVPCIIEQELSNMRQAYGAGFLSAITKAFWMMRQHPVVIYDGYAWEGLRRLGLEPGYDGYRSYYASWFRFFDNRNTQRELDEALSWLPESEYIRGLIRDGVMDAPSLKSISDSQWLRNRVADRYLTRIGGVNFK